MLGLPWQRREERESTQTAYALLDRVGLAHRANELAGSLAYGEQRRLEIARALGTRPGVILLDEPAAGTNPAEKRELAALIRQINADGVSVLLIEHDMKLVMSVAAPDRRAQLRRRRSPRGRRSRSSAIPPWSRPTSAPRRRRRSRSWRPTTSPSCVASTPAVTR